MRSSNLRSRWADIVVAVCSVIALGGPVLARANVSDEATPSVATRHAGAISRGLNHEDARVATERIPDTAASPATKHAAAMERGLNHEDARVASQSDRNGTSPAKKHATAMGRGLNHEEARIATDAR